MKPNTQQYSLPEGAMPYDQLNGYYRECIAERDALRAENARLREALTRITVETSRRMASGGGKEHFQDGNREAGNVARALLREFGED